MSITEILKSELSDGAKLIAIAIVNGARTAREAAEQCSMNIRTAERHYANARILLRNIAYSTPQICVVDTQECVDASRAHKLPQENIKTPIVPKLDLEPPPADKPKVARKRACLSGFDEFWELYPKRTGKAAAEKAWPRAVDRASSSETIIEALRAQLPAMNAKERQYIKNPSTWLNQACWEDDVEKPQKNGKITKAQLAGLSDEEAYRLLRSQMRAH